VLSEYFPAQLAGLRAGSLVAGYRLEAQVGAGGMAVVFRARDERLSRLVALKVLAPALAADPGFRRRFIAESRAAAAVDDPHIIPIYEAGESGGALFIAMRFVRGGDLRLVLDREGPLPPGRATGFISPVASALDAAHRAGLVHRDVKPANILVDAQADRPDHVYLSDFGVSKGAISSVSLTGTGHFLGTPDYSAPEQIRGHVVDGRTDQYALACVAYQLLTGSVPFGRDQGMAVLFAHLSELPPSLGAGLPEAADRVLAKALAKVPDQRYGSCGDFADALREALGLAPYTVRSSASVLGHPQPGITVLPSAFPGPAASGRETAAGAADRVAAATTDSVPVNGPGIEGVPAAAGAPGQPTGNRGTAGRPASVADILPAQRPHHGVARGRHTVAASIRRHRLAAMVLAGTVLAAAGIVPFVLPSSPSSSSPALGSRGLGSHAPSSDTPSSGAASSGAPSARPPSSRAPGSGATTYSRIATLLPTSTISGASSMTFSPSGTTLAAPDGYTVDLWDLATKTRAATFPNAGSSVAFSPDGTTVATGDGDGSVYLWNVATRHIASVNVPVNGGAWVVAFSPDGKILAIAGEGGRTYLWNVATKTVTATLTDPSLHSALSVAFSPDGTTLAIGSNDRRIYLWNIATKTLTATLADPKGVFIYSVAFSPNGATLAAGNSQTGTYFFDVATGTVTAALTSPSGNGVNEIAFSPSGTALAEGGNDGRTYLWNVATAKLTATLIDPDSQSVRSVAFSPDGATLAVGHEDGRIYLWRKG
jgi:serine/threonine-protein kinase